MNTAYFGALEQNGKMERLSKAEHASVLGQPVIEESG